MGDRMFASEGDSVNVGRLGATAHADRWERSGPTRTGSDEATSWTARRLQGRLDRQQWLLDRHLNAEPAVVPELLEIARRMRRDTEVLQILCGADLDLGGSGAARRLADAVTDSVSAADEPSRVAVRPAPGASIGPTASVEFGHVLSAVIDHVIVTYPDARVDLASRVENLGGVTVDIAVDGAMRHEPDAPDARCTYTVAEQLALRSRHGVELRRPVGGPPASGSGLVLSVHCPPSSVTVDEPVWPSTSATGDRFRARTSSTGGFPAARGNGYPGEQSGGFYRDTPATRTGGFYADERPTPSPAAAYGGPNGNGNGYDPNDPLGLGYGSSRPGDDAYRGYADSGADGNGYGTNGYSGNGNGNGYGAGTGYNDNGYRNTYSGNGYDSGGYPGNGNGTNGNGYAATGYSDNGYSGNGYASTGNGYSPPQDNSPSAMTGPSLPAYQPSRASGVDELFGPLLDLPIEPMDDRFATPIFEAIASVWFRDDENNSDGSGLEWETPNDAEWRAASERAVSTPTPDSLTATGLPRRRPGGQLVPPPLSRRPVPSASPAERVPDRVRDRLSTYQRGLRQGRHRAPGDHSEYGDW